MYTGAYYKLYNLKSSNVATAAAAESGCVKFKGVGQRDERRTKEMEQS